MKSLGEGGAVIGAALFLGLYVARRFIRYEVRGESMSPTLHAGDYVVVDMAVYRRRVPRAGEVVVASDPREPARELVKRVREVDRSVGVWLEGDDPSASTDSRVFGHAPLDALHGRVLFRYAPRFTRF